MNSRMLAWLTATLVSSFLSSTVAHAKAYFDVSGRVGFAQGAIHGSGVSGSSPPYDYTVIQDCTLDPSDPNYGTYQMSQLDVMVADGWGTIASDSNTCVFPPASLQDLSTLRMQWDDFIVTDGISRNGVSMPRSRLEQQMSTDRRWQRRSLKRLSAGVRCVDADEVSGPYREPAVMRLGPSTCAAK